MRFLPYEELKIWTTLDADEVFYRLRFVVQRQDARGLLSFSASKPYYGRVGRHGFKISRHTWYRNSFKPVILGSISPDNMGSQVHIVMRLDWLVFFFWVFWLGGVALVTLAIYSGLLIAALQSQVQMSLALWDLIPIGMLAFGYLMTLIAFKVEAAVSRKFLFDLLKLQSVDYEIFAEDKLFGLSEAQIISLVILAVAVLATGYFAITLLI